MQTVTETQVFEIIKNGFRKMTESEIVMAPWLVDNNKLNEKIRLELQTTAHQLSEAYSNSQILWWTSISVPPKFRQQAYYEILLSTAAYLSHMRLGTLIITEEMLAVSVSLLKNFLESDGGSSLLSLYTRIVAYLNGQLLRYYGRVSKEVFVSGAWHRPWIEYTLEPELEFGLKSDLYEQIEDNGKSYVQLTPLGEKLYFACQRDLEKCGYLKQREQLIRASNFTNMDDYEEMLERFSPEAHDVRKTLIKKSGIKPGMKVLELGCGAGALTLNDGLYKAVGAQGSIIATDPSVGMLARAKAKLTNYDASNVQFQQAAAENLPFPENTFDAVIGMLFLHFTDIPKALQEIQRVSKPGGTFTTLLGLEFKMVDDFFMEWFQPVFKMGLVSGRRATLPQRDLIPSIAGQYFEKFECQVEEGLMDISHVEDFVKFSVQAGTMAELNELPWEARNTLFRELIDRGYAIRDKYGAEAMKRPQEGQWFKGTVKK